MINLEENKITKYIFFLLWIDFIDFFRDGGGVLDPILFCINILVGVNLGYTLNFDFLSHLELPFAFVNPTLGFGT